MIETLSDPLFWIICFSLVAIIWVYKRISTAAAYKLGAKHGFTYGVDCTVNTLIDQKFIKDKDYAGNPITRQQVVTAVMPLVLSKVLKDFKNEV